MTSPLGPSLISCSEVPSSTMVNSGLFLGMKKEMPVRASSLSLMVVSSLGNSNVTSSLACWTWVTSGRGKRKAGLPSVVVKARAEPSKAREPQLWPLRERGCSLTAGRPALLRVWMSASVNPTKLTVGPSERLTARRQERCGVRDQERAEISSAGTSTVLPPPERFQMMPVGEALRLPDAC